MSIGDIHTNTNTLGLDHWACSRLGLEMKRQIKKALENLEKLAKQQTFLGWFLKAIMGRIGLLSRIQSWIKQYIKIEIKIKSMCVSDLSIFICGC